MIVKHSLEEQALEWQLVPPDRSKLEITTVDRDWDVPPTRLV
jgi:hypothetical protein